MTSGSTDVRDLAAARQGEETAEGAASTAFIYEIVEAATSRRPDGAWRSAVRCIARRGRKTCRARIQVALAAAGRITWSCTACPACGVVTGFVGSALDRSVYIPRKTKLRVFGFDDEGRQLLRSATMLLPELSAVVARARPAQDVPELLVVEATVDELDGLYTLIAQMLDETSHRRRRALLDGMLSDLCTAIDGF